MADSWGEGRSAPAHLTANIYAFDTSTGWSGTCAVTPEDLIRAADILEGSQSRRNAALIHAHHELLRAADRNIVAGENAARRTMVLNMYYISPVPNIERWFAHATAQCRGIGYVCFTDSSKVRA